MGQFVCIGRPDCPLCAPLFSGATGNGTSLHAAVQKDAVVKSLCGVTVWTGSNSFDPNSGRACRTCVKRGGYTEASGAHKVS